jgi:Ca2+-binding RTX toxin-like protein
MATITVTNTNDSGADSLRQAVIDAAAGDTIVFDASLAGQTITLASQIALDKTITINGDVNGDRKADVVISGNDATRIFDISGGGTLAVLRSLTLTEGGPATGTGGAIRAGSGTQLALIDSTVSNSTASVGGGIASAGTLWVVNSTLTGNEAIAVFLTTANAAFVNATIHDNAGGIALLGASFATILSSTISGTAASTVALNVDSGNAVVRNSVIADNDGPNVLVFGSSSLAAGSSFFDTAAPITNDQGGNIVMGGDPMLGPLQDNGGPVHTQAILPGSPLIGAGNTALLPTDFFDLDGDSNTGEALPLDARGFARVLNGTLDIGANEFGLVVTTASDSASAGNDIGASLAADIADGGGLSLREAITWAAAGETITFAAGLAGQTITLEQGQLVLAKDLTITGDVDGDRKADITISGNDATRIFEIIGAGTEVELRSLTLTEGNAGISFGGAILAQSGTALSVIDSTIADSAADTGGGIYAGGATLRVVNSTLAGNEATSFGGGVSIADGSASFVNATIHDNHSNASFSNGGGIDAVTAGGGVTLTILNSTITDNTAASGSGGGGVYLGGTGATATVHNSVIAGNTSGQGDIRIFSGSLTAESSLIGTGALGVTNGVDGNLAGTLASPLDPLLGALADNGGPVQTQAILSGSPLIGAGNAALLPDDDFDLDGDGNTGEALPLDARGNARVLDGALDIGATEAVSLIVTTASDSASAGNDIGASLAADIADGGGLSLREAIAWAAAGDTVVFASGLAGSTITLEQGQLALTKDIVINGDVDGDRKADITISGNDVSRIFLITGAFGTVTEVELRSLTLTQGNAGNNPGGAIEANNGGGIHSAGTLAVVNSTITGNAANNIGGGVYVLAGSASFVNATIHGNSASATGGGIFTNASTTILNSSVTGNTAGGNGGGIHILVSNTATIQNSVVAGNSGGLSDVFKQGTLAAGSSFFGTTVTINNDQGGNIINGGDPLLGALADNGGPVQTQAILSGSPLIGAGNAALLPVDSFDLDGDSNTGEALPLDARGFARVMNGALDIGATEQTPPLLSGVDSPVTFAENTVNVTPQLFDADVTLSDPDDNFHGGTLTVTGLLAEDTVSIRNQGIGAGQIGFNSVTGHITFAGILIGAAIGGAGGTLTVAFNASATAAAIEALIENLTYANSSDAPTASRILSITVIDAHGSATSADITVEVTDESDIGITIVGSNKNDLVDASNTVPGKPLPTDVNDIIRGNQGNDDLSGLLGNDIIDGGKGIDILRGGGGNDILQIRGSEGTRDVLDGGTGTDTLQLLGNGNVTLAGFDATASSIEILQGNGRALFGTKDADAFDFSGLTAISGVSHVDGKGGNDSLAGSNFGDDLRGGGGDDTLDGGAGNDVLTGGAGVDTFVFADGYGADTVRDYKPGTDIFDFTGIAGVNDFGDLFLTQIDPKTVLIDFDGVAGGDTLTVQKTTIAALTANQGDFVFA